MTSPLNPQKRKARITKKTTSDPDMGTDDISVTVHASVLLDVESTGAMGMHGNAITDMGPNNDPNSPVTPGCEDALAPCGTDYLSD